MGGKRVMQHASDPITVPWRVLYLIVKNCQKEPIIKQNSPMSNYNDLIFENMFQT